MKKLILILSAITFVFTSCSSDDDNPTTPTQDPIIGTWKVFKYFQDNVEIALEPCESETTLVFNANGDYTLTDYIEVTTTCEIDDLVIATWSNDGNNNYTFTEGTSPPETTLITFEGNTFYIEYTETVNDVDPILVTYKDVYQKQ